MVDYMRIPQWGEYMFFRDAGFLLCKKEGIFSLDRIVEKQVFTQNLSENKGGASFEM